MKAMAKIKPVYIMNQEGLTALEKEAVLEGVRELMCLANVSTIEVNDLNVWRNKKSKDKGVFVPYQSVDWYIQRGKETSRNRFQLNAQTMQRELMIEPWRYSSQGGRDHYDILIVKDDMYLENTNFVIGLAVKGIGTTISTHRFNGLDNKVKYECIKTETMHEVGHTFGLIPKTRRTGVEESLGKHCTNICIMRQGLSLPDDWIKMSNDRLKYSALCPICAQDLKNNFKV